MYSRNADIPDQKKKQHTTTKQHHFISLNRVFTFTISERTRFCSILLILLPIHIELGLGLHCHSIEWPTLNSIPIPYPIYSQHYFYFAPTLVSVSLSVFASTCFYQDRPLVLFAPHSRRHSCGYFCFTVFCEAPGISQRWLGLAWLGVSVGLFLFFYSCFGCLLGCLIALHFCLLEYYIVFVLYPSTTTYYLLPTITRKGSMWPWLEQNNLLLSRWIKLVILSIIILLSTPSPGQWLTPPPSPGRR